METILSYNEAKKLNFKNEYELQKFETHFKEGEELKKFVPDAIVQFRVNTHDDGTTSFEWGLIYIQRGEVLINVRKNVKRNATKWLFFLETELRVSNRHLNFTPLKNITRDDQKRVQNDLIEPNQIGVLSDKKVNLWIDYLTKTFEALKLIDSENGNEKAKFLESIKDLPVKWHSDNKRGSIVQNGIELSFELTETGVQQRLSLYYAVTSSVKNFIDLSNNQYKNIK